VSVVVDASVTLDWFFRSERASYGNKVLQHVLREGCVQPINWASEVAHGLVKGVRKQQVIVEEAQRAMELLRTIETKVDQPDWRTLMTRLYGLSQKHNTSGYDAAYVELALRQNLPLAAGHRPS
jgi:predicted nucleic acid-binding protein